MITIKPISQGHLNEVARIHLAAFPESALTRLGLESVRRYYEWQLTGPHQCYAVGGFDGAVLKGFCFGGRFKGALTGYLQKNRIFLISQILKHPQIIRNPIIQERIKLARKLLTPRSRKPKPLPPTPSSVPSFGILSIATHPVSQGRGVGRALMQAAEEMAVNQGFSQMHLTVEPSNENAIRFYENQGWYRQENESTQWNGKMLKNIGASKSLRTDMI